MASHMFASLCRGSDEWSTAGPMEEIYIGCAYYYGENPPNTAKTETGGEGVCHRNKTETNETEFRL